MDKDHGGEGSGASRPGPRDIEDSSARLNDASAAGLPEEVREAPQSARFGKYVIVQTIGIGGMGAVWKAYDVELKRWVALKILKGTDPEEMARFKREAELVAQLSHPNIAPVFEVGEHEGRHFMAMQYVAGVTLTSYPRGDRRALVEIVRDAARALHYAHHRGVVHRDVKPANIMVEEPGPESGPRRVFVTDFGLARRLEGGGSSSTSRTVAGTAPYISPEQARGGATDARSDIYSLGATLYTLLADHPPFMGRSVPEVLTKVEREEPPPIAGDLGCVVSKAMSKDPNLRYQTAAELADDLHRWLAGETVRAASPGLGYRVRRSFAKRPQAILIGALTLIALAATLALVVRGSGQAAREKAERTKRRLHVERDAIEAELRDADRAFEAREYLRAAELARATIDRCQALAADREAQAVVTDGRALLAVDGPLRSARRLAGLAICREAWIGWVLRDDDEGTLGSMLEALKVSAEHPEVFAYRGLLHLRAGRLAAAAADLDRAEREIPDDGFVRLARADLALQRGALDEAEKLLSGPLPKGSESCVMRGLLEMARGDFDAALTQFRAAPPYSETNRAAADAALGSARCLLKLGRPEEARQSLERIVQRLDKGSQWTGNASLASGRRGQVADAYLLHGQACLDAGDRARAIKSLEAAAKLRPQHAETQQLLEQARKR